ncbi:MAG: ABC transporter permease subunit [Aigarchaeota archaeon]|nr:ABC transporter permease subunit [Aigarchaeota archaeon]
MRQEKALLDRLSSSALLRRTTYGSALAFFLLIVLAPVVAGLVLKLPTVSEALSDPKQLEGMVPALAISFQIAALATVIDVLTGLPLAWLISRRSGRWVDYLDTLVDMPLIMPTAALGYSVLLFWSAGGGLSEVFGGQIVSPGWILIFLLHLTFTYPYIVRTLVGIIRETDLSYEIAARTLGASPFTAFRTVSLSLLRSGILAAIALAFSRSLSETGATLMVAGSTETATVYIKNRLNAGGEAPLVVTSILLIALALIVLLITSIAARRLRLPLWGAWPRAERRLSTRTATSVRNAGALLFFALGILVPAFFLFAPAFSQQGLPELSASVSASGEWSGFWPSIATSFEVAGVTVAVNVLFGLPMAIALARGKYGRAGHVIDSLVNVPLIVPTVALGTSLRFFWLGLGFSSFFPEIILVILAHVSFTYPFVVRTTAASIEGVNPELEDTARTLGASPFSIFRTLTLPLAANALFAGILMAFTRSMDETGATIAVARDVRTAPLLLVDWVSGAQAGSMPVSRAAWGCLWLTAASFAAVLISRWITRRR